MDQSLRVDFVGESVVSWWSNVDGLVDRYGAKLRLIRKFVIRTPMGRYARCWKFLGSVSARFVRDPIIFWITS